MFGVDCQSPTEAALLPTSPMEPTNVADYRGKLILLLSSAQELATVNIHTAQGRYKTHYDKKCKTMQLGDWDLVRFPRRGVGDTGSCPDRGKGLTGLLNGGIQM